MSLVHGVKVVIIPVLVGQTPCQHLIKMPLTTPAALIIPLIYEEVEKLILTQD